MPFLSVPSLAQLLQVCLPHVPVPSLDKLLSPESYGFLTGLTLDHRLYSITFNRKIIINKIAENLYFQSLATIYYTFTPSMLKAIVCPIDKG